MSDMSITVIYHGLLYDSDTSITVIYHGLLYDF